MSDDTLTSGRSALLEDVLNLSRQARLEVPSLAGQLTEIENRAEQPLRVAIAGKVKAGKSTLLNALVGDELAPTDAGECTRVVTWYQHGLVYRVETTDGQGISEQVPFSRDDGAIEVDLRGRSIDEIERITVDWPVKPLKEMTLIDTPGIASLSTDVSAKSYAFMTPDDEASTPSDAVIYLLRHLHASDVSFLHSFHDAEYAQPSPINCVAVLSRADEVAAGRLDAMESATKIANRYSTDDRLRRLVQTVLPVAGLLAQAGTGLRELEFRRLVKMADAPASETDRLLLTADRFINAPVDFGLDEAQRRALLGRLGLFGVRYSVDTIRRGEAGSTASLAQILRDASGIDLLRSTLIDVFGARRDTLKARSALLAMQRLVGEHQISADLAGNIERTIAGAHEFTELRLLNELRSGSLDLPDDDVHTLERLLGGSGTSVAQRLEIGEDLGPERQKEAVLAALTRWQNRAESPLSTRPIAEAARVAVRTCEGLFVGLSE